MSLQAIAAEASQAVIELFEQLSSQTANIDPITMLLVLGLIVALIFISAIQIYLKIRRQLAPIHDDLQTAISTSIDQNQELQADKQHQHGGDDVPTSQQPKQQRPNELWQPAAAAEPKYAEPDALVHAQMKWLHESTASNKILEQEILDSLLKQLNGKSEKMVAENGLFVVFSMLEETKNPKFEQLKESEQIDESIIMYMKFTCDQLIMQVRVASDNHHTDPNRFAIYNVTLDNFSALLKVVGIPNESYYLVRMIERPENKTDIKGPLLGSKNKFNPDVIINAVVNIFYATTYSISFDKYLDFPKSAAAHTKSGTNSGSDSSSQQPTIERKLLLTIIKADELDLDPSDGHQLQCTVEVDEPIKTFTTSTIRDDVRSPVWNQYFLIHLSEQSKKLYFELSDAQRNNNKNNISNKNPGQVQNIPHQNTVLGHAFVDLDDLRSNPLQKKTLQLISESTKQELGQLVVELLLMEHPKSISPSTPGSINNNDDGGFPGKPSNIDNRNEVNMVPPHLVNNKTQPQPVQQVQQKPTTYPFEYISRRSTLESQWTVFNLDDYLEAATSTTREQLQQIRSPPIALDDDQDDDWELNDGQHSSSSSTTSTSSFSEHYEKDIEDIEKLMGVDINNNNNADVPMILKSNQEEGGYQQQQPEQPNVVEQDTSNKQSKLSSASNQDLKQTEEVKHFRKFKTLEQKLSDTGSRSNESKPFRNLRNLKKRFSFKRRAKSVERQASNRSVPNPNDFDRARSVPGSREPSIVRETFRANGRESLANMSQVSTDTNYFEDSILILRCNDDKKGQGRHYVLPDAVSYKKIKPKLKGKKLHLFKNHLFMAIHKPAANLCQVCHSKLPFSPFKQAYQCVDCGFYCHKNCHVHVRELCPRSSINELILYKLNGEPIDDLSRFNSFSNNYNNGNNSGNNNGNSSTNNFYMVNDSNNNRIPRLTVTDVEDLSDVGEEEAEEKTNLHLV